MYNAKEKSTGVVAYLPYVRILWIVSDKIRRSIVRFLLIYICVELDLANNIQATHILTQHFGHCHTAVCVLILLNYGRDKA